jgi:hypothetical protein
MTDVPEHDEVAAHQYRLAQANRVIRFCEAKGIDYSELIAGRLDKSVLVPIMDEDGTITPELVDLEAVKKQQGD